MTPGNVETEPSLALPLRAHEGFGNPAQNERYECHKVVGGTRDPVRYHEPVATVEHPTDTLLSLTPIAAAKIKELMAEEDDAATLVFLNTISEAGFKIDNPNAVSSCGCGHSFQVEEGEELPEGTHVGGCGDGCSH